MKRKETLTKGRGKLVVKAMSKDHVHKDFVTGTKLRFCQVSLPSTGTKISFYPIIDDATFLISVLLFICHTMGLLPKPLSPLILNEQPHAGGMDPCPPVLAWSLEMILLHSLLGAIVAALTKYLVSLLVQ